MTATKAPCEEAQMQSAPVATQPCAQSAEPWILAATIIGSSMVFIDGTVVGVALPILQSELGASVTAVQWVFEAYALVLASLLLVGGSLGDRLGRRRIFVAGVVVFALASVACGLAPDINASLNSGSAKETLGIRKATML